MINTSNDHLVFITKDKWQGMHIYATWCEDNSIKRWHCGSNNWFYFYKKEDAVLFQLTWL